LRPHALTRSAAKVRITRLDVAPEKAEPSAKEAVAKKLLRLALEHEKHRASEDPVPHLSPMAGLMRRGHDEKRL